MADILTCRSRKSAGETNFDNDGSIPSSVPAGHESEPASNKPGP